MTSPTAATPRQWALCRAFKNRYTVDPLVSSLGFLLTIPFQGRIVRPIGIAPHYALSSSSS